MAQRRAALTSSIAVNAAHPPRSGRRGPRAPPELRQPARGIPERAGCAGPHRLTVGARVASITSAMPQPSHIYASTLDRRSRSWSRRRPVSPAAALSALLVLSVAVVLAGLG